MTKGIRTTITVLAVAIVAAVGMTGCSVSPSREDIMEQEAQLMQEREAQFREQFPDEIEFFFYNEETGKITKAVNYGGETVFNEGASSSDTKVVKGEGNYPMNVKEETATSVTTTVELDGKPYPMTVTLDWEMDSGNFLDQVDRYNAVATPEDGGLLMVYGSVHVALYSLYNAPFAESAKAVAETIEFQATGRTVTVADERIIAGEAAGTPAWQVLQEITGSPVTSERYYYSNLCASYDVAIANEEAVIAAAQALPNADMMYNFNVHSSKSSFLIETAQPCTIEAYEDANSNQKDWNQNPSNNPKPYPPANSDVNYGDPGNPWG